MAAAWFGIAMAAGSGPAHAELAWIAPAKDSTLIEDPDGALANGSGPAFFAGRNNARAGSIRRALLAFDVASVLPPGSTVTGVTLSLSMSSTSGGPVSVRLHRVLADWGEGASYSSGGGGASSEPGDSTWIHRYHDQVFWSAPGGDFDPGPRATTPVDQVGFYVWGSTPEMVADVQSWLDGPEANFGWMLIGDEDFPQTVKRFDSRESPDASTRPLLEVQYLPPCSPDPRGLGYWKRECTALLDAGEFPGVGHGAAALTTGPGASADPGFAERVLPCADRMLADLGLSGIDACVAVLSQPRSDCPARAVRKLSVLALNVCAERLQTTCEVAPAEGSCLATNVGDLLREISLRILSGDCRGASGCSGIGD
jgi:hypothetical protein